MDHIQTNYSEFSNRTQRERYVEGHGEWIADRMGQGWPGYIVTFMFRHLRGSDRSVATQMAHELQRVFAKSLTRIVKRPLSERNVDKLPLWMASPDFPVFKHAKHSLRDVTVNGGRHLHAIALIPPRSRMREGLDEHFDRYQDLYVGSSFRLKRIHVEPITHDPEYATAYILKALARARVNTADIILLPRARSEIKTTRRHRFRLID